jgi:tetratricopeptide (TPR) repeat protein
MRSSQRNIALIISACQISVFVGFAESAVAGGVSDLLSQPLAPKYDFSSRQTKSSKVSPDGGAVSSAGNGSSGRDPSKIALQQATTLYSQGRVAEAESAFKHVLALNSHSVDAFFNLGVINETRGDLQNALAYYRSAQAISPDDAELRDAVSSVQVKISQKMAADQRVKEADQTNLNANQNRDSLKQIASDAQSAFKAGNFDKAITNLKMVSSQAPNDPDVQYALAQAYKGKGDLQNARGALNRALSIEPNNQLYLTLLSQLDGQNVGAIGTTNQASRPINGNPGDVYATSQGLPYTPYNSPISAAPLGWQSADNSQTGQLTPFTSQGESSLPGSYRRAQGYDGGYSSGFYHGSNSGYGTKTRLTRVAVGAGAGLAIGAIFGAGSHHAGRSMMTGALMGGALGLFSGGW